jgi:hypothetical protein
MNKWGLGSVEAVMNHTILGLAVMVTVMGATVARADDCGPQPTYAPAGQNWNSGSYQLQTTQVWVPGTTQQVWQPGTCSQIRGPFGGYIQRCSQGYYRTVVTAGYYENRQNWVWVANYDYRYERNGNRYGNRWNNGNGNRRHGRHGAVPVGY